MLRIGFIMDFWEDIDIRWDSTLRMIEESKKRGHEVFIFYANDICSLDSATYGYAKEIVNPESYSNIFDYYNNVTLEEKLIRLDSLDSLILRKDPPFDDRLLNFLDTVKKEVAIINDVDGIRMASTKLYTTTFKDLGETFIPKTYISKNKEILKKVFLESESDKMILKPLDGFAGNGVLLLDKKTEKNINALLDFYVPKNYAILQEYVKGAEKGDIRVLMLNGEPVGSFRRVPASDDIRANICKGGSIEKYELTKEEEAFCKRVGERLRRDGLDIVGLDLIEGKLIEINVQSPGGLTDYNELNGTTIETKFINFIEEKVAKFKLPKEIKGLKINTEVLKKEA